MKEDPQNYSTTSACQCPMCQPHCPHCGRPYPYYGYPYYPGPFHSRPFFGAPMYSYPPAHQVCYPVVKLRKYVRHHRVHWRKVVVTVCSWRRW